MIFSLSLGNSSSLEWRFVSSVLGGPVSLTDITSKAFIEFGQKNMQKAVCKQDLNCYLVIFIKKSQVAIILISFIIKMSTRPEGSVRSTKPAAPANHHNRVTFVHQNSGAPHQLRSLVSSDGHFISTTASSLLMKQMRSIKLPSVGRISYSSSSSFHTCLFNKFSSPTTFSAIMANTTATAPPTEEQPWHAAFPSPKAVATPVSREQMRDWLTGDKVPGKDFVLVDLRRNDYKVRLRWLPAIEMRTMHRHWGDNTAPS